MTDICVGERWLPIPSFPGYEASCLGRIRTYKGKRRGVLKPQITNGYETLKLSLDSKYSWARVHRLVLEAFVGPAPEGTHCAHLNGNRRDNRIANLRWATRSENEADKVEHQTSNHGSRNGRSRLTEDQVQAIRREWRRGRTHYISRKYGIAAPTISEIVNRRTWKHI